MALNFPNAPSDGQEFTDPSNGVTYQYSLANDAWSVIMSATGASGSFTTVDGNSVTVTNGLVSALVPTPGGSFNLVIDPGSAGSPGLYFSGDIDTGIWSPGADQFAISTGGVAYFVIDELGQVGIGNISPEHNLSVRSNGSQEVLIGSTNSSGASLFLDGNSNGDGVGGDFATISHTAAGLTLSIQENKPILFLTGSGNTEKFRISDGGALGVAGANYGNAGQVLTSTGASGSPVWQDNVSGNAVTPSATPPVSPNVGDIWFDTDALKSYVYYSDPDSNQWVEMNPGAAGIPDNSVTSSKIVDGSIGTVDLGLGIVTEEKLATNAVTEDKIANNAITTDKVADGSITAAKLASGAGGGISSVTGSEPIFIDGTALAPNVNIRSASTLQAGAVQLEDSTASVSTTLAATANAVKSAYDLASSASTTAGLAETAANAAMPLAGGSFTGRTAPDSTDVAENGTFALNNVVNHSGGTVNNPTSGIAGMTGIFYFTGAPTDWGSDYPRTPDVSNKTLPYVIPFYFTGGQVRLGQAVEV